MLFVHELVSAALTPDSSPWFSIPRWRIGKKIVSILCRIIRIVS